MVAGSYTFEILMYKVDGATGEELLIQHASVVDQQVVSSFKKEFVMTQLKDIGSTVKFVVFDNTGYRPGMKPLGLFAWKHESTTPILVRFAFNSTGNMEMRRMQFTVKNFRMCMFEFDVAWMRAGLLQ